MGPRIKKIPGNWKVSKNDGRKMKFMINYIGWWNLKYKIWNEILFMSRIMRMFIPVIDQTTEYIRRVSSGISQFCQRQAQITHLNAMFLFDGLRNTSSFNFHIQLYLTANVHHRKNPRILLTRWKRKHLFRFSCLKNVNASHHFQAHHENRKKLVFSLSPSMVCFSHKCHI